MKYRIHRLALNSISGQSRQSSSSWRTIDSETMKINADWLFSPETLDEGKIDPAAIASFCRACHAGGREICEVNQRGIRSSAASHGVLMQEEYEVFAFREWVQQEPGDPLLAAFPGSRAGRRKERG